VRLALVALSLAVLATGCAARAGGGAALRPVRIGTSGDYPPYSASAGDGTLHGFDVEAARAWSRDRGRDVELVAFRWPELESRLAKGDFDVAMSGVTVRGDRLARSPMSAAVARTEAVLVLRPGAGRFDPSRGGAGLVVAVNRGGHMERVARATLPRATLQPTDDNRALADMLARGGADGVVVDSAELASFYPDPEGQMPPIAAVLSRDRKAWWVGPGDPALANDLDAWIATREADGTLPALRARWGLEPRGAFDAKSRLADLVGRRLLLMPLVAEAKRREGRPIEDLAREAKVIDAWVASARAAGLDEASVAVFARAQIEAAKSVQRAVLAAQPRRGRTRASGAAEANAADAGDDVVISLEALRPAISRVDGEIQCELARSAPLGVSPVEIASAIRESATVPGLDHQDVARIAVALAAIPAARRPSADPAGPAGEVALGAGRIVESAPPAPDQPVGAGPP